VKALQLDRRRRELSNSLIPIKAPMADIARVSLVTDPAMPRFPRMRTAPTALALTAALLLAAGCGSKDAPSNAPSKAEVQRAFQGSPPKLQAIHNQGGQLLDGGKDAFQKRLAELRGYPVVINSWGSWCAPCRGEFPVFQQVAVKEGKQVAFLGLDAQDNDGNARKFLKEFPVTYPSYKDPDVKISNTVRAGGFFPTTIFFNKTGKLVYAHPGPYNDEKDLIADIRRYAE
jgi:cytochrome c biogenesis protein CcmG/thiol:disulfide interchange protein DsbE